MQAVEISQPGPPEVLRVCSRPIPVPADGEVLIRVAAAGVNRPDCVQRAGGYPPPPGASDLPGLEIAGMVIAVAPGVTVPAVGDRVCALVAGGGSLLITSGLLGACGTLLMLNGLTLALKLPFLG